MAKKKSDSEGLNLEDLADTSIVAGESSMDVSFIDDETTAPEVESEPSPLLPGGEDEQFVSLTLPKAVLYALIDPAFESADLYRAEQLGLSTDGKPTELGQRVLNGTDAIALSHKINTAYRTAHNRAVDADRKGIVRA